MLRGEGSVDRWEESVDRWEESVDRWEESDKQSANRASAGGSDVSSPRHHLTRYPRLML